MLLGEGGLGPQPPTSVLVGSPGEAPGVSSGDIPRGEFTLGSCHSLDAQMFPSPEPFKEAGWLGLQGIFCSQARFAMNLRKWKHFSTKANGVMLQSDYPCLTEMMQLYRVEVVI